MNPHFFTAPFYFDLVQGSRFRALVAASPPFFRRWYSRIAAFPSRGRCPEGADRAQAVFKSLVTSHLKLLIPNP